MTGFGRFGTIINNPTTFLVQNLPKYLKNNLKINYKIIDARVIPVDIQNCDKALKEINQIICSQKNNFKNILILHLGVYAGTVNFRIERQGCNNESFGIPDMAGNQPINQQIDKKYSLDSKIISCIDVDKLQKSLSQEGFPCVVSNDAGKFICNYTYYCSLDKVQQPNSNVLSLFVHVPNFSEVSPDVGLKFFSRLLNNYFNN